MTGDAHDRRAFLRGLLGARAGGARAAPAAEPRPPAPPRAGATLGRPASRPASRDDLSALVAETELDARLDDVQRLARWSVRLTPGAPAAPAYRGSRLGGVPHLPLGLVWPHRHGRPLAPLAQLDLAALPPTEALPPSGTLWCFYDTAPSPSGVRVADAGACAMVFAAGAAGALERREPPGAAQAGPGVELAPSAELMLPRAWSDPVERLGLDDAERDRWRRLCARLAALQGVEQSAEVAGPLTIHRVLGFADERRGDMPLACALLASGADLEDAPARMHPDAPAHEGAAARWRLLLELTVRAQPGWTWAPGGERLYVWITEEDLARREFARVRAFLR